MKTAPFFSWGRLPGRRAGAVAALAWALMFCIGAQAQPGAAGAALDSPYGLNALWAQSDLVAKSVLVILAVMSAGSWRRKMVA